VSRGRYGRTREIHVPMEDRLKTRLVQQIRDGFFLDGEVRFR
jgi:hypothetical protein